MVDFLNRRPLPSALRNLGTKWLALRSDQHPWLELSRFLFLPLLITWAALSALSPDLPDHPGALHKLNILCLCAALTAFWSRPPGKWSPRLMEIVVGLMVGLLLGWVWITLPNAPVPETSFPYAVLALDAALLFFAILLAMSFRPVAMLTTLVLGHLFCWLGALGSPGDSILIARPEIGLGPLVWSLVFFGGFLWTLTLTGKIVGRRRWLLLLLVLLLPIALFWMARVNTTRSNAGKPNHLFRQPNREIVVETARSLFRDHVLEGVGLGGFAAHLAGRETSIDGGKIPNGIHIEFLPSRFSNLPALAAWQDEVAKEQTPVFASGNSPFLIASGLSSEDALPPPLSSLRVLSVEMGMMGTGLLLLTVMLLFGHSLTCIVLAPPSLAALRAIGLLGLWLSIAAEGFMSLALLHPYGLVLFWILAGAAWGAARKLPRRRVILPVFVPLPEPSSVEKETEVWDDDWDLLSPREQRMRLLGRELENEPPAPQKPVVSLLDEPEENHFSLLEEPEQSMGPPAAHSLWEQWLPLPQRWITFLIALVSAVLLAQITAMPLKGWQLARTIDPEKRTGSPAGRTLAQACQLNSHTAQPAIDQARYLVSNIKYGDTTLPAIEKIEMSLHDAIDRNPFRDDAYALLASFHSSRGEVYKTGRAIADGRDHCPQSLSLALWRVSYARLSGIPSDIESAWHSAIELSPFDKPEIKGIWLRELLEYLESRNDWMKALDVARTLYFMNPGDAAARQSIDRIQTLQAQRFANMQKSPHSE